MCKKTIFEILFIVSMTALLATCVHATDSTDEANDPTVLQIVMGLRDGSNLRGTLPVDLEVPLETSIGKLQIPLKLIRAIQSNDDEETIHVVFHNADWIAEVDCDDD